MKKGFLNKIVIGAVTLTAAWGIGTYTHAEEIVTAPEYGVIEEVDGGWIGSDSLLPEEEITEDSTDKNVDEAVNNTEEVTEDTTEDTTDNSDTNTKDTVVEEPVVETPVVEEPVFDKATTLEFPYVDQVDVGQKPVVVDAVDNTVDAVDETVNTVKDTVDTNETVESTISSDDTVIEDSTEDTTVDSSNEEITDDTVVDNNFHVDFTDDFVSENDAEVKGDDLYEEKISTKSNDFHVDFVDDFVSDGDIKGDDIFPTPVDPEPTPVDPEPTPVEPKKEPVINPSTPSDEVTVTPVKKNTVVDEKTPQVLGDNLFDSPKTGDTTNFLLLFGTMFLSLFTLFLMHKKRVVEQ